MSRAVDEQLLDDADALASRDRTDLLRALASAGSLVRRAEAASGEWGLDSLADAATPRAILVATDEPGGAIIDVLRAVSADFAPVIAWSEDQLPRWCGPADALLVASVDGARPWLPQLVAAAGRRGLAIAVAAPAGSPLAASGRMVRAVVAETPFDLPARTALWGLLTPLLLALGALGAASITPTLLTQVADALDDLATECRPSADAMTNPAKLLALELAETRPVIAGAGPLAAAAARVFASRLAQLAGEAAVAGALPQDGGVLAAMIEREDAAGADDDTVDDFFRDRVEDAPVRPRLVLISIPQSPPGSQSGDAEPFGVSDAAARAEGALVGAARVHNVRVSGVPTPEAPPLAQFAAAAAFADFTAAYLAFARGMDPGALRAADLADLGGRS
jgi:glucose/mannose-6-phosphate isomerase